MEKLNAQAYSDELAFMLSHGYAKSTTAGLYYHGDNRRLEGDLLSIRRTSVGGYEVVHLDSVTSAIHTSPVMETYEAAYVYAEIGSWKS